MRIDNSFRGVGKSPAAPLKADVRIATELRRRVARLGAGALLPSVRELSAEFVASPVTVQRAMAQLAREGLVVSRPGDGTYVAERTKESPSADSSWQLTVLGPAADPIARAAFELPVSGALVLGSGYLDVSLQPLSLLARAARRAAANPRAWDRLPPEGHPELRLWFARDVGGHARAEDVVLAPGGQAALAATFRTLVPFGGPILVESPTYFGALSIARSLGLKPIPVPHDGEGIRADLLEAAFASTGARALYLQPAFSNPSGITLSEGRRKDVLRLAERAGAFVIEDDYARDLAFGASPPAPLFRQAGDRVVYIRSLTKSTAPGLRVAGIIAKGPVLGRLRMLRATEDFFVAGILQDTALELVNAAGWGNYVQKLRHTLRDRCDVSIRALARHWPKARLQRVPEGGFSLWIELPAGADDLAFVAAAANAGVSLMPGVPWFAAERPGAFVRVGTAGANATDLEAGIARLGALSV
ncbi:MAG TPA: PLP-dependent aminotransferase family protein [Polyangiaceae bacterium]|nr:PLP-dependent aminotransferase family protein [Polyangiaceae bacterium]